MSTLGQVLAIALNIYWFILLARLVLDLVQVFARNWRPTGALLVIAEAVFTVTDPPIKLVRRVIPPIRLGQVQFDLAFLVVIIAVQILMGLALRL